MSESKNGKSRKTYTTGKQKKAHVLAVNFYGALKSKNEIYFQMASLFKEVTQEGNNLENKWIERILTANPSNSSGKISSNNI